MSSERDNDAAAARDFQPAARLRGIEKSMIRQLFDRALPGSINLGLGEPDLPTPDVIRRAAVRVIQEEQNGYTTHAGLPALRALVSADYPQLHATTDDVIITAGSQEALYLALLTLVDEGDEVLLPDPGFVAYPTIVRMAGGRPVFYRLPARDAFAFDAEDFRRRLTPRTKAVVVISPSNPTGRALSRRDLAAMADALGDSAAYVISDEIYREIYFGDERPPSVSETHAARSIVIGGLSKSMSMTGWRVGWMCGAQEVIKSALVLHGYVTTCASTVSQKAALAAWTDEAAAARAETRRIFRARRDQLLSLIEHELKLPAIAPEGAFYLMLDVSAHGSSLEVAERLLAHRVITVPGSAFGKEGEGYLRLSFCADAPTLAEGVKRIKSALE
ncbi:MAG: aspartate aminotransferase [Pyrinomonadaceae bacterium]|nr:aspartate aminotransferase [Pyrinomonadaceae bacterium]